MGRLATVVKRTTATPRDLEAVRQAAAARAKRLADLPKDRVRIRKGSKNHGVGKRRSHEAADHELRAKLKAGRNAARANDLKAAVRAYWRGDSDECP